MCLRQNAVVLALRGNRMLNFTLWLSNLGSVVLGMTLAAVALSMFNSRHGRNDVGESCLVSVICLFGAGVSTLLYVTAMTL